MLDSFYNHLLERVVLPTGDFVEGGEFMRWLHQYRREQWLPAEQLQQIQRERLTRVLSFARKNVPFYANVPPALIDPKQDIKQFPILRKTVIKNSIEQLITEPKEKLIASSGSGSSGVQGTVYHDKSAQASQRAMQLLWFEWSGYRMGDSILQTGMTMQRGFVKGMKDYFLRTSYIPAFDLDAESIERVLLEIEKNPKQYLFGYASSLFLLAQTAIDLGISGVKFEYAVSWGDKMFPHYRERIRRAFGCETIDTYGCTEGAMIAAQCTAGNFHLSINQCYVEIVDDDGNSVPNGEMGKVLVTRLDNFAMPLIRYYVGDLAELDTEEKTDCGCGRQLPLLRRVVGRDTDIVCTRSGKRMIVHFFTGIFEHVPQIRQFKVVQENLDGIEIHFIPDENFERSVLSDVETKIYANLGEKFPIVWVETEHIAPTKSGKPQIIQSFLQQSLTH
jgi:phenylacetate-CoA ligase